MKTKIASIALLGLTIAMNAQEPIVKNDSEANYPSLTSRGNIFQLYRNTNNTLELGVAGRSNTRRSWILSRHYDVSGSYGKYYSTLHLQPDTGDKSQYKGVAIGYGADTHVQTGTHLAVNGNVGIGTFSPSEKLEVNGHVKFDALSSSHTNLQIGHDVNDRIIVDNSLTKPYGGGYFFRVTPDPSLNIPHNYINVMMLTDNGNVGIGTSDTKGFKLGVNGKIAATEVKVATYANWPDYVFVDDYKLPTLKEVENHIKENGHLKNIPSAKEVEKNGIMLGEMNKKLLEKIEELTLYTIQQEKAIKGLKNQEKRIKNQEEALKRENKKVALLEERLAKLEKLLENKK